MATPTRTTRQPVTSPQPRPEATRLPWQGLFQEAVYEGGQPYAIEGDEEDDE